MNPTFATGRAAGFAAETTAEPRATVTVVLTYVKMIMIYS